MARQDGDAFVPEFDIRESSSAYFLEGAFPGANAKDISIEWTEDQVLAIQGVVKVGNTEAEWGQVPVQDTQTSFGDRKTGKFWRSFRFPGKIQQDGCEAKFDKGLLKIMVPKDVIALPSRVVPIQEVEGEKSRI
jgi:HSP20 family protein